MNIIVDLIITIVSYMTLPFLIFHWKKYKFSKKQITFINIINSFIFMCIFIILRDYLKIDTSYNSGAPAFLYFIINNSIYSKYAIESDSKQQIIKKNKKNKFRHLHTTINSKKVLSIIVIALLIVSIGLNIYFGINYNIFKNIIKKKNNEIENRINEYNSIAIDLFQIRNGKSTNYIKNKLNFFDNNIVFIIDGYGNYYSDYDCMLQRTGNKNYSYLALNKNSAIAMGYSEYKCESSGIISH